MLKKSFLILLTIILSISLCTCDIMAVNYSRYELEELLFDTLTKKENAHNMANAARALGYAEDHVIILIAKNEWAKADEAEKYYNELYQELIEEERLRLWRKKEKEYPTASYIWKFFKDLGYNDYVIAGILGNIMAEAGGQTLDIQYKIYSSNKNYYGICQWSMTYYKDIKNGSLEEQCNFLNNNIKSEFDSFGYKYKDGFKFEDFLLLDNEQDAALAFALAYERCNSESHYQRQVNATAALEYFKGI